MKRRISKKYIRKVERIVAATLSSLLNMKRGGALHDGNISELLGTDLTSLLLARIRLARPGLHHVFWLDGIEWSSLSMTRDRVKGAGTLWVGRRSNFDAALSPEPLEIELIPNRRGKHDSLLYTVRFGVGGSKFVAQSNRELISISDS